MHWEGVGNSLAYMKNLSAFYHYLPFEFYKKNDSKQTWKNAIILLRQAFQ